MSILRWKPSEPPRRNPTPREDDSDLVSPLNKELLDRMLFVESDLKGALASGSSLNKQLHCRAFYPFLFCPRFVV